MLERTRVCSLQFWGFTTKRIIKAVGITAVYVENLMSTSSFPLTACYVEFSPHCLCGNAPTVIIDQSINDGSPPSFQSSFIYKLFWQKQGREGASLTSKGSSMPDPLWASASFLGQPRSGDQLTERERKAEAGPRSRVERHHSGI